MAYLLMVAMTMFVLPLGSMGVEFAAGRSDLFWLTGKWFVFWGVGVRLAVAGARQYVQPAFTSRDLLGIDSPEVYVIVRELGGANFAAGVVGITSLAAPSFVMPCAIGAAIFYLVAGVEHMKSKARGRNENIAMTSDLFLAFVLAAFTLCALRSA
jgi:hypothetical protein